MSTDANRSPFTADLVARQGLRLGSVVIDGGTLYWLEGRPADAGRNVIVAQGPDGRRRDRIPSGFNVRTRVHEYGGGAFAVDAGQIVFANFADQRLYRLDAESMTPVAITSASGCFFASLAIDRARQRVIAVREDHRSADREAETALVSVALSGGAPGDEAGTVLASGYDFYSSPQISPDGSQLAWLSWRHPQMPWDGTELWLAPVAPDGSLGTASRIAGGETESIYQPGWSPDGVLHFSSDRSGWWQLYRWVSSSDGAGTRQPVIANPPGESEFGRAAWTFGTQTWAFADRARLLTSYARRGRWHLGLVDAATGTLAPLAADLQPLEWLAGDGTQALLIAASPTSASAVVRVDLTTGLHETLRSTVEMPLDPAWISVPEAVEFPTTGGRTAHAFYYPPRHAGASPIEGRYPPLVAISHGGPTTASTGTLDLRIQFWTSRGFAVVDVNYGGSTGYGRPYRERLNGQWGIVDVDDMIAAVRYLSTQRKADPDRLVIRGGSAGGYTTLAALTGHPGVFRAGASYYGVSDVEVLVRDTHKFESRYLDTLIGPYPAMRDEYRARSPIHHVERLACALIFFQGLEDRVVPPNQSAMMADAARQKGLPVAYLTFEGEQHGFRRAESVVRCLEAELGFYGAVLGFVPADPIAPFTIDNL